MDCNRWREMASDYIEGTLPEATRKAMQQHALSCDACREDDAVLRALCRELNVLPAADPPLFFADNVRSAIERSGARAGFWQRLFFGNGTAGNRSWYEPAGRLTVGAFLAGGVAVALGWSLLAPGGVVRHNGAAMSTQAAVVSPLNGLLPGEDANNAATGNSAADAAKAPALDVTRVTTIAPGTGPVYDLSFNLRNADHGVAHWRFVGDPKSYTFTLNGSAPQTVRVPYSAVQGQNALALNVRWAAGGATHSRYLLLPVANADAAASTVAPPGEYQSFGLPDETVVDAARDVAARFGVPITLDDVSPTARVQVTARDETAEAALARCLQASGLKVETSTTGILVRSGTP